MDTTSTLQICVIPAMMGKPTASTAIPGVEVQCGVTTVLTHITFPTTLLEHAHSAPMGLANV
jgi:hypothetical protein